MSRAMISGMCQIIPAEWIKLMAVPESSQRLTYGSLFLLVSISLW